MAENEEITSPSIEESYGKSRKVEAVISTILGCSSPDSGVIRLDVPTLRISNTK
jgi:hypothetical protein